MSTDSGKPVIVQSDSTLLLDVHNQNFEDARDEISPFAELEKSPEHMHTYRINPLSLWNAASAGLDTNRILERLEKWSRFEIPENVRVSISELLSRFGKLILIPTDRDDELRLTISDKYIAAEVSGHKRLAGYLRPHGDDFIVPLIHRGTIKQELIKIGYPVRDEVPLVDGGEYQFSLLDRASDGRTFTIRDYQEEAVRAFLGSGGAGNGFGAVVLPCGAGKTIVGMVAMERLQTRTLILTTNIAAVHQWIDELTDKTSITRDDIGEYSGHTKCIRPITVCTYQILTWRPDRESPFPHFDIFRKENWGLIIYDEVHLLPAPVFRVTAEIQAVRRLGLTATLVREDGREEDVFSLIGPKRYDVPWKELEAKGWIAQAYCHEIRVPLPDELKIAYAVADKRRKYRIASENPTKIEISRQIIDNHPEDPILVIGQYLDQLHELAAELKAPLITGKTPNPERERIYADFKRGAVRVIVVSKVANFAIDLPDASVAIQVSGTFGSRQEEAQRLGRILRPKQRNSYFFSLVSRFTTEEEFAANRQKFLAEQGYKYHIDIWDA